MTDPDIDEMLAQFNQLIEALLEGSLHRSTFQPWEIEILVDMVGCNVRGTAKSANILRAYRNAVQQQMQAGARVPLKLSEYLESLQIGGNRRKSAAKQNASGAHG